MNDFIKLPSYEWFIGLMNLGGKGNTYVGSYGTDPYYGCLKKETFHYRAWIEKDENDEKLFKALYYIGNNAFDETDSAQMTEKIFEVSYAGIDEAHNWLLEALKAYDENGGKAENE